MRKSQLYRHYDRDGALLYVGMSTNAIARLRSHKDAPWSHEISRIEMESFPDGASAKAAEQRAIREENPVFNKERIAELATPYLTRDPETPGLFTRLRPSGHRSFVVVFSKRGKRVWRTLKGATSIDDARVKAKAIARRGTE